jgi:hypothetical protein
MIVQTSPVVAVLTATACRHNTFLGAPLLLAARLVGERTIGAAIRLVPVIAVIPQADRVIVHRWGYLATARLGEWTFERAFGSADEWRSVAEAVWKLFSYGCG